MSDIRFYHVDDAYIAYLKTVHRFIWNNEDEGRRRPYLGIIFEISNFKYFAPLTSYKPEKTNNKYEREDLKIIKIRGRTVAVLQINNMIPVDDSLISIADLTVEDSDYVNLVNGELANLRGRKETIFSDAKSTYKKVVDDPLNNQNFVRRCYDFKLLERKLSEYLTKKA